MLRTQIVATKGERQWQGIPGIERAANGRLWATFFSGGPQEPDPANFILINTSTDDGRTWSDPQTLIDPPGPTRAYDPALWHDPRGRLWLFYNHACLETRQFSVLAITADDATVPEPRWSEPQDLNLDAAFMVSLNRPTVLSSGAWLLPVTMTPQRPDDWFGELRYQAVAISTDAGATWELGGSAEVPGRSCETMTVERADGSVWMLVRTDTGVLWQTTSHDGGRTWDAAKPTDIVSPWSRFFIGRLQSGRLLLIHTPDPEKRKVLKATLSDPDDDTVFRGGLVLDPREKVSYPDAVQAPDGLIYAVHDRERLGAGEIILDVFSEEDIIKSDEVEKV